MPEIKIILKPCQGKDEIVYKSDDVELMNAIVQLIAKKNGVSISQLKRKGDGGG